MLRFCTKQVTLVGNLEKAFLMVAIEESHKDFLRFLWINCLEITTKETVMKPFCHLVFGLSPSQFLLNATLSSHVTSMKIWIVSLLKNFCQVFMLMIYLQEVIPLQMLFSCFLNSKLCMQEAGFRMGYSRKYPHPPPPPHGRHWKSCKKCSVSMTGNPQICPKFCKF